MKKLIMVTLFTLMLIGNKQATACVGKTLYIGISSSANEQLLAEMVSVLVSERTGTTVKILTYKDSKEIYNAVKQGQVGLMIENTDHALVLMSKPKENSAKAAYELVKKEYRKNLNLVWLEPFGSMPASQSSYAPVITAEVLGNLPALPKLINKLTGILNEGSYAKLVKAVKDDEKPKKVARDFLKARKLI
jgi:glycine betaine/choline ABC-type transport system substrate-binding protein